MDNDIRKGQICGLISTGLHLEGLLRVALERSADNPELTEEIRQTFQRYTAVFDKLFPAMAAHQVEAREAEPQPAVVVTLEPEESADCESPDSSAEAPEDAPEPEIVVDIEAPEMPDVAVKERNTEVHERPLSEALKVDELIARKESADLRKAFTLNDKFRFRRTIFGGSDQLFVHTLEELEKLSRFDDALAMLSEILPADGEDNEDFLNIVKQHFDSKL